MGWLFSIILFIMACVTGDSNTMIASGLFAIAGTIGWNSIGKQTL